MPSRFPCLQPLHPGSPALQVRISELEGTRHNIPKHYIHHAPCPITNIPKSSLRSDGETCSCHLLLCFISLFLTMPLPARQQLPSPMNTFLPCTSPQDFLLPHSESVIQQIGKTTSLSKGISRSFGVAPDTAVPEKTGLGEGLSIAQRNLLLGKMCLHC